MNSYHELNAREFWERFRRDDSVSGVKCLDDLSPTWGHLNFNGKELTKCRLKKLVLSNVTIKDLTILDCSIDSLEINKGCRFENPLFIKKSNIGTVIFGACTARVIVIDDQSVVKSLTFNSTECPVIIVRDSKLVSLKVISIIRQKIELSDSIVTKEITLSGAELEVKVDQIQCERIDLINNKRNNTFTNLECALIKWKSSGSEIQTCNDCRIGEFQLRNTIINEMQINGGSYGKFYFDNSRIERLRNKAPAQVTILKSLVMNDSILAIDLYYLRIGELFLTKKNLNGGFQLTNATIENSLRIRDSRLDGAKFNNIDLYNASMELVDSSITGSQFVNIKWPKGHLLAEPSRLNDRAIELKDLYALRESYRQMKVLCNKEMNHFEELIFKKHELRIYWKIINIRTYSISWSSFFENIEDWLILWTNKEFSNFGMSVFRPLVSLVVINLLLFYRIINLYDFGITASIENNNWDAFWRGLGLFVNLLNPVHPFVIENVNILGFTDITMRVVSGYLLYYFLKASRKFSG